MRNKEPKSGSTTPPHNMDNHRPWIKRIFVLILIIVPLSCVGVMVIVETWPSFGSQVANHTRNLIGPRAVAGIETIVFQAQDLLKQWRFQLTGRQAEAPWEITPLTTERKHATQIVDKEISPTEEPAIQNQTPTATEPPTSPKQQIPDMIQGAVSSPTPTPYVWQPAPLNPYGIMENEGIWQPYLYDKDGNMVAARTFLQPDPDRPYTIVAVVAFDLNRTQLHFVLGFNEPSIPDGPRGDGLIPEEDHQAGILLAAFNGGFRAANGHFGAMSNGIEALPPKDGMATVGIYQSGEVQIGSWGEDINSSPELESWRQNCPLIIQDGEISPQVYSDSITDWGASISNQIVTRRSGLGLDQSARTLYYFAGPSLSMPVLADAMKNTGVHQGMLLDINHFWVHFTAIRVQDGELVAEPLIPSDMIDQIDRYLGPSPADFFYITAIEDPLP